jgi:hypothetical protein
LSDKEGGGGGKVDRHTMVAVLQLDSIASSSLPCTGIEKAEKERGGGGIDLTFAFTLPDLYQESALRKLLDAAHTSSAAGSGVYAVNKSKCVVVVDRCKFSGNDGNNGGMEKGRIVVIIEGGTRQEPGRHP